MLSLTPTQHYLVGIRLQRKISFVTSLQFLNDLKSTTYNYNEKNCLESLK